ncbi:hypothetical protein PIB30_039462 [Stylosanthes scabra]|uniref:Uncharacterized protein n=1 Tax=Stylosanthes scabra TaxID=79078 RepID=A0ABU6VEZ9_9FABA|nr:hypothetical protein [Stylosanthes scabra]
MEVEERVRDFEERVRRDWRRGKNTSPSLSFITATSNCNAVAILLSSLEGQKEKDGTTDRGAAFAATELCVALKPCCGWKRKLLLRVEFGFSGGRIGRRKKKNW